MSQMKNYSKMYLPDDQSIVTEEAVEQHTEETKPEATTVTGTVIKCAKLNVREQMNTNSAVLCVLPASAEVTVLEDEKHDEWYHVFTASGIEGFCMKKYIQL